MRLFRRRPRGRHALGAAVTAIPSGPAVVALPPVAPAAPAVEAPPVAAAEPDVLTSIAELIATGEAWRAPGEVAAPAVPVPPIEVVVPPAAGPRVQLGFRDGSTEALAPDSEQAIALELLARTLAGRD